MTQTRYSQLAAITIILALCVILLGAFTRLSDAGLGCPDWPGCYGHMGVPASDVDVVAAELLHPERAVEPAKAWKEMIHRYFAGTLGLLILALAIFAWRMKPTSVSRALPTVLVAVVIFQALLGMYTVTLLLKPVVVMGHLLGGFLTLSLLVWLYLESSRAQAFASQTLRPLLTFALVVVVFQIALGGWTSSNYAALACPDFPMCQGQWLPETDFSEGFVLWRGLGINYEFGVLEHPARTAIHLAHRLGAIVTLLVVAVSAFKLYGASAAGAKGWSVAIFFLLITQVALGISNVVFHLPLFVAVLHNGVAALLLVSLVGVNYKLRVR